MHSNMWNVVRNPFTCSATSVIALLLFFLPFVELKCKKTDRDDLSGLSSSIEENSVTVKMTGFGMMQGKIQNHKDSLSILGSKDEKMIRPQILVTIAFIVGLIGLVFSMITFGERSLVVTSAHALAAMMLSIERFYFKKSLDPGFHLQHAKVEDMVEVNFSLWFYLSTALFILAGFLAYKQGLWKIKKHFDFEQT
jgi:hypothetical protein